MIETGKILQQRYRIDKQIGQGGMGAVYVATDERFGSTVAIKETLCMDDNYRKAIEREARLLNSLKHPALPRVTDHFLEENGQFLVMEYIAGEDLYSILEETHEPFPVDKVLDWADQLLEALEFLHGQSMPVVHRDIKPQNLKVTPQGRIVLLDFGLAKGNPTDAGFQTAAKSIFGYSRNYASLEQIQGTGTDPRSDLYSLAATLYHLATGQVPEDALTRAMAVLGHRPDPLTPANAIRPEIPAGFAGVLLKALDLNAPGRPSSAAEMRAMLREMDDFAHLADLNSAVTVANFDAGAQKTQLMPGVTRNYPDPQTGVKTEILPQYISQETSIRTDGSKAGTDPEIPAVRAGGTRRFAIAASGALLLIVGLAAGAYIYDPMMFSHREMPVERQEAVLPAAKTEVPAAEEANASTELPGGPADTGRPAEQPQRTGAERPTAARQTARGSDPGANASAVAAPGASTEAGVDGKTIYVGNVKIRGEKIETPDVIIDEKGVIRKVPVGPMAPNVMVPDPRYMTPQQRRKLQELRRRGIIPPPQAPAQPRPTP
jgi:serine/threonine protein kinase